MHHQISSIFPYMEVAPEHCTFCHSHITHGTSSHTGAELGFSPPAFNLARGRMHACEWLRALVTRQASASLQIYTENKKELFPAINIYCSCDMLPLLAAYLYYIFLAYNSYSTVQCVVHHHLIVLCFVHFPLAI